MAYFNNLYRESLVQIIYIYIDVLLESFFLRSLNKILNKEFLLNKHNTQLIKTMKILVIFVNFSCCLGKYFEFGFFG